MSRLVKVLSLNQAGLTVAAALLVVPFAVYLVWRAVNRPIGEAPREQVSAPTQPHFSRAAIVGALLVPVFIGAVVQLIFVSANFREYNLFALCLLIFGLCSPLLTTMFGFIGISQVRHSGGRVYGIGLSLADAMFLPALLLLGLVTAGVIAVQMLLIRGGGTHGE